MITTSNLTEEDIRFLYNELRKASVVWKGRSEVLKAARKKVLDRRGKSGKPIYKYHWQCASCKKWSRDVKSMEVDHIVEIGGLGDFKGDWNELIAKIFPRPVAKHLQALCIICHQRKTIAYMAAPARWERKKKL